MVAGCGDDDSGTAATPATVALGGLPESLPTVPVAATTEPTQPEPVASSAPSESGATSFAVELDAVGEPPPSRTITDDTGRLRVTVPRDWDERRTEPATDGDGAEMPSLSAAPDMTEFLDGYEAPGLTALVADDSPEDALDTYDFREDCVATGREPFVGDDVEGVYEIWRDCGGTDTDIVTIAVQPDGADQTVLVLAQLVEPTDAAALDHALATLSLRD